MCFIAKSWYNRKRGVDYESKKNYICPFSCSFYLFFLSVKMNEHYDNWQDIHELTDEQTNLVLNILIQRKLITSNAKIEPEFLPYNNRRL